MVPPFKPAFHCNYDYLQFVVCVVWCVCACLCVYVCVFVFVCVCVCVSKIKSTVQCPRPGIYLTNIKGCTQHKLAQPLYLGAVYMNFKKFILMPVHNQGVMVYVVFVAVLSLVC